MDNFEAKHESQYGEIVSSWHKSGNEIIYNVTVPANSTATLFLKGKNLKENDKDISENRNIEILENEDSQIKLELASGYYSFKIR